MKIRENYIKRCIEIAKNGLGTTAPNPMVGCVIAHDGVIIGEGFTSSYGGPHAEVNAINSVADKSLLGQSTIYVTLEPCSHFGKTPPCSDLIIKYGIKNAVIGTLDINDKVSGRGMKQLKEAGCHVTVGVLEEECKEHHKRFFTFHNKQRPYIILKWAETTDGFIAPSTKEEVKPIWITNKHSRQLVHKWRTEEQAILVGTNTVLKDNPSLTTRHWNGRNPIRYVIDRNNKLSEKYNIFDDSAKTTVLSESNINFNQPIAKQICNVLFQHQIQSVIIEGGSQTLQTFIDEDLWDEARVFKGSSKFETGTPAPTFSGQLISKKKLIDDVLNLYIND